MDRLVPASMSPTEQALVALADVEQLLERSVRARRWFVYTAVAASIVCWLYARIHFAPFIVGPILFFLFSVAALSAAAAELRASKKRDRLIEHIPEDVRFELGIA
jgi:apolipoprotein N-acyltransferase